MRRAVTQPVSSLERSTNATVPSQVSKRSAELARHRPAGNRFIRGRSLHAAGHAWARQARPATRGGSAKEAARRQAAQFRPSPRRYPHISRVIATARGARGPCAGQTAGPLREVDQEASRPGTPLLTCRHPQAVPIGAAVRYRVPLVPNAAFKASHRIRVVLTSDTDACLLRSDVRPYAFETTGSFQRGCAPCPLRSFCRCPGHAEPQGASSLAGSIILGSDFLSLTCSTRVAWGTCGGRTGGATPSRARTGIPGDRGGCSCPGLSAGARAVTGACGCIAPSRAAGPSGTSRRTSQALSSPDSIRLRSPAS